MGEITAIAATMTAMSQARLQDQISMSLLKMNARAEAAVADLLMQNARQIQASSGSSSSFVDLYV